MRAGRPGGGRASWLQEAQKQLEDRPGSGDHTRLSRARAATVTRSTASAFAWGLQSIKMTSTQEVTVIAIVGLLSICGLVVAMKAYSNWQEQRSTVADSSDWEVSIDDGQSGADLEAGGSKKLKSIKKKNPLKSQSQDESLDSYQTQNRLFQAQNTTGIVAFIPMFTNMGSACMQDAPASTRAQKPPGADGLEGTESSCALGGLRRGLIFLM